MAATRTRARGLSEEELSRIRQAVAAGRRPKVVFTEAAGQIAGQVGQVVALRDPAEGEEWLVVRFGRDELPFSPGDLQVTPRGAAARKPAVEAPRPEPEFVIDKPARRDAGKAPGGRAAGTAPARAAAPAPAPRRAAPGDVPAATGESAAAAGTATPGTPPVAGRTASGPRRSGSPAAATGSRRTGPGDASAPKAGAGDVSAPKAGDGAGTRRASPGDGSASPRRTRPGRGTAQVTVTLAYGDGQWTVSAAQGPKVLARPCPVTSAQAMRMVSLVDAPGVREAVERILAAERAEAEQEAQRLRARLAEVESRLAELRDPG